MTAAVVALQIVVPLALLAWLSRVSAAGRVAYALHVGATAVVLLTLALVAMFQSRCTSGKERRIRR